MAVHATPQETESSAAVEMFWKFDRDGDVLPSLNTQNSELEELILETYDAESVEGLADEITPNSRPVQKIRLGIITGVNTNSPEFHTDAELLEQVEGVTPELAAGLLDWWRDIPTLCEERRRDGEVLLGDLLNDAQVEDRDWVGDLKALIDDFGPQDNLEARMKNAGVWVEPDNAVSEW